MKKCLHKAFFSSACVCMALIFLAGCAGIKPEKRHSPAELAAYKVENFAAPIASLAGEAAARTDALEKIRLALVQPASTNYLRSSDSANADTKVPDALGAVALFNIEQDAGRGLVLAALADFERDIKQPSIEYQRAVIAAAYMLYPQESAASLNRLLEQLQTPREFAMATYTVLKANNTADSRMDLRATLVRRFPDWMAEPRLSALEHVLTTDTLAELAQRPPLVDLLAARFRKLGPALPVIYSFQRKDRQRFGLAMVRGPDGQFVRQADGSYFNIPHLAMALTNLPGTITNGNTPQGLFTIVGAGTATNKWIGPTPYLHSKIPIEATVAEFEHADLIQAPEGWTEARYESFLPASWRDYKPFKEAFLAGQAGRDDMLLHGTTINADYYRGTTFYPGTPSAGCLVAMESWSKADGILQRSDQLSLAKAFTASGVDQGYLVVVELDNLPLSVTLADVMSDVIAAEAVALISRMAQLPKN